MDQTVTPMLRVVDVQATIEWYESVGFKVEATQNAEGEVNWARLSFGVSAIMVSAGGSSDPGHHRDVDLYIQPVDVDGLYDRLRDRVEVHREPYDAFHGNRELILRDNSGFWVVFAQPARN